jgi:acyl-CoA thioesterase-1
MTISPLEKLIRFQRPERALTYARSLTDATIAGLFGTDETTYRHTRDRLDADRTRAAAELGADPNVTERLARVPFAHAQRLVAIGESTTADRLSWFEILRTLLSPARPDLELSFDNLAVSGATTTQVLATVPGLRRSRPDWVFCMLGANDVQRFGSSTGPRLVSQAETLRNLDQLRALSHLPDTATWVWLTPTPVDETLVSAYPYFAGPGLVWTNRDIDDLRVTLTQQQDRHNIVIDTRAAFTGRDAYLDDGLHPSVTAQQALAAHVLAQLAA